LRILEPVVVPGDACSQHRAVVVKSVEAPVAESAVMPPAGSRNRTRKNGARFKSGHHQPCKEQTVPVDFVCNLKGFSAHVTSEVARSYTCDTTSQSTLRLCLLC